MLRHVRNHLPRLQPTLRTFGINLAVAGRAEFLRSSRPSSQQTLASPPRRVTTRPCSSSATIGAAETDDDMASKHLETSHQRIFDNNRKWVAKMKDEDPEFFVKLGSGQSPEYLFAPPSLPLPNPKSPFNSVLRIAQIHRLL